ILTAITLVLGLYLIVTTVLIAKDGVVYIQHAQKMAQQHTATYKSYLPGYPFLIWTAHQFAGLFSNKTSNQTWIYAAQGVNLLCRLLALIPLYFTGKLFVGTKNSFWALIILILLPFSAELGSDVLREWPYLLFLSTGFFLLLWGSEYKKWWAFGGVGLAAGFGYLVRFESIQLIVYAVLWLAGCILRTQSSGYSKKKIVLITLLLIACFAIPVVPYLLIADNIIPANIRHIWRMITSSNPLNQKPAGELMYLTAGLFSGDTFHAFEEMFKTFGENLMWVFLPPLIIGMIHRLKTQAEPVEKFFITTAVLLNIALMFIRYLYVQPAISSRWTFILVVYTFYYIPDGFRILNEWIRNVFKKSDVLQIPQSTNTASCLSILLLICISICLPKLLRPIRNDKPGYLKASSWLAGNSDKDDIIAAEDGRLFYYAQREGMTFCSEYTKDVFPPQARYLVRLLRPNESLEISADVSIKYSTWVNEKEKRKRIVVYGRD
ncbi:MAG: glycosyltransferase family 39 protein, partial [Deltaproteobacteria bacterium]|nr:glycosyltransferase family 39 protein [Deltaproteobacteria bacterium]